MSHLNSFAKDFRKSRYLLALVLVSVVVVILTVGVVYLQNASNRSEQKSPVVTQKICRERVETMIPPQSVALSSEPLPKSVKGYELTSFLWEKEIYSVFDVGLNRVRTTDDPKLEIGLRHTVTGIEALKPTIGQIAWGEQVTWCALDLAGTSIVEDIVTFGRDRGISIIVIEG